MRYPGTWSSRSSVVRPVGWPQFRTVVPPIGCCVLVPPTSFGVRWLTARWSATPPCPFGLVTESSVDPFVGRCTLILLRVHWLVSLPPRVCGLARLLVSHTLLPSMGFVSRPVRWSLRPHPTRVHWLAYLLVSLSHALLFSRGLPADLFVDHCALILPSKVRWLACWLVNHALLPSRGSSADPFVDHCTLISSRARCLVSHALTHYRVHIWCPFFTGSTAGGPVFILMGSTLSWTFPHGFHISWTFSHGFHILWTYLWVPHLADLSYGFHISWTHLQWFHTSWLFFYGFCILRTYIHGFHILWTFPHGFCILRTYIHGFCILQTYIHGFHMSWTYLHGFCILRTYFHGSHTSWTYLHGFRILWTYFCEFYILLPDASWVPPLVTLHYIYLLISLIFYGNMILSFIYMPFWHLILYSSIYLVYPLYLLQRQVRRHKGMSEIFISNHHILHWRRLTLAYSKSYLTRFLTFSTTMWPIVFCIRSHIFGFMLTRFPIFRFVIPASCFYFVFFISSHHEYWYDIVNFCASS